MNYPTYDAPTIPIVIPREQIEALLQQAAQQRQQGAQQATPASVGANGDRVMRTRDPVNVSVTDQDGTIHEFRNVTFFDWHPTGIRVGLIHDDGSDYFINPIHMHVDTKLA